MTLPATYPLDLYRGDSFGVTFALWQDAGATVPVDLAGASARSQIRRTQGAGDVLADLVCSIAAPNLVTVGLSPADWPDPDAIAGDAAVWDLELTYADGTVYTPVAGPVRITSDVTRA